MVRDLWLAGGQVWAACECLSMLGAVALWVKNSVAVALFGAI